MLKRVLKSALLSLLFLFGLLVLLMLMPRFWALLNPKKPPVGYYFLPPTILSVYSGIESLAEKIPPLPDNIVAIKNVEYKNCKGKSLQIDFYHLRNGRPNAPLLLFVHGGGWSHGDRNEYLNYALYFAELGYATATTTYRVVKDAPYPACVEDLGDAVRFLFEHGEQYQFDPERIALIGGSAGAHLSMLVAYGWHPGEKETICNDTLPKSPKIKALVEMYGPVDLTTDYARNHSMVTRLMAHPYSEQPRQYAEASPLFWVDRDAPPTLILHGTRDMLVPIAQAEQLKYKLDSLGVPNVFLPLPGWPHTMDLVKRVQDYSKGSMKDFFEKYVQ